MFELPRDKKRYFTPVLFTSVVCCIFASLLFVHHKPRFPGNYGIPFDSAQWKLASIRGGYYLSNTSMLDDYIAHYQLVGQSRQQLHELLGCEGLTTEKVERQLLQSGSCTDITQLFLEVEFDDFWQKNPLKQKAARFRLLSEHHRMFYGGEDKTDASDWYN